jgi:hypothetical protein
MSKTYKINASVSPPSTNLSNLEVAARLDEIFDNPTEFMADVIRRFAYMAEIEQQEFCNCPVCGVTIEL